MTGRETILARIREALREPASRTAATGNIREVLPPVGSSYEQWRDQFSHASRELRTQFVPCPSLAEAASALRQLADENHWKSAATHGNGPAHSLAKSLPIPTINCDGGYDALQLEQCDAGITGCDAIIAQTGSVLVTSASAGGRALSALPPHHVVVATRAQLLADLPAAYELLHRKYAQRFPSMISFITGPSRTGDIERILVLGAHGPRKLTVLLVESD